MSILRSAATPLVAAVTGASLALLVHFLPPALDGASLTVITVDAPDHGAGFAVISDGFLPGGETTFRTPHTFRLRGEELNAFFVPLDPGVPLQVSTEQWTPRSRSQARSSGRAGYANARVVATGLGMGDVPVGELAARLSDTGVAFTGVQFGGGLSCADPEVWNLALDERLLEAREACTRIHRQRR